MAKPPAKKRDLSPETRQRLRDAGLVGATTRWDPEAVKEATAAGTPIPTAPVHPRSAPSAAEGEKDGAIHPPDPVNSGPGVKEEVVTPQPGSDEPRPVSGVTIVNETPEPKGGPAPPSWYQSSLPKAGPDADAPKGPESNPDFDLGSGMLVDTVSMAHGWAADESGYEGWRLTPDEIELWRKIIRFALRHLPLKDWPIIATLVALAIMEGKKFIGWSRFRKAKGKPTRPIKAPPPEEESTPATPSQQGPPTGAYMAPGRRRG